jgi:hypothetical protein
MGFKTLLTLHNAPDFDTVTCEPLHDERCLVLFSAKPVEHEDQQYVELFSQRGFSYVLDGITVIRRRFIPRHPLLRPRINDFPALPNAKLLTGLLLHGDVVLLDLPEGGHAV